MSDAAIIEGLRHSINLADYIGQYLELKREGNEAVACCPFHSEQTPSFKVSLTKNIWCCFGCGQNDVHGSDIFGFVRSYFDCTFPEAVLKLQNGNGAGTAKPLIRPPLKKAPKRQTFPDPSGAVPDMERGDLGAPVKVWTICLRDGTPYYYEARYLVDGAKETRYYTFGRYSDADPPRWECKFPASPRPFYGLETLGDDAQVMIHEAPKKAEAARTLFPALAHLGLCGGRNAVPYTDLTPLRGRRCILLPDNDEVGRQAMRRLAPLLWAAGAAEVKGIDPDTQPDGTTTSDGWDVADSTGWTPAIALQWARERKVDYPRDDQPMAQIPQAVRPGDAAANLPPFHVAAPQSSAAIDPQPEPQANAESFPLSANGQSRPEPDGSDQTSAPYEPAPRPADGPLSDPLGDAAAVAGSPDAPGDANAPALIPTPKPALLVVEGNTLRKPRQEIEPEPEQLPAFSEVALAEAFAKGQGEDWRYTAAWGVWAEWNGTRWVQDERKRITYIVKGCCKAAIQAHIADSTPAQKMKITTLKTVNAVMGIACAEPGIATGAEQWDADPYLLGTPAGIIDLHTGEPVPSDKAQMVSKSTSVAPEPGPHPWWDRCLERATGSPKEFLQLWCGYMLTGDTKEERFLFVHGPGGAGKSKFLLALSEILGDYRRTAAMESFTVQQRREHSEEIARLAGARMVVATETDEGSRWNEARIKALTGRDAIAARHMHRSTFEFKPQFKLVFVGNHKPALRSVGEEMRRRIDLVEWGESIPEADRVLDLPDKLRAEYPAILAWMIEGCMRWQAEGLGKPAQVAASVQDYMQGEDTLGSWLEECAELKPEERAKTTACYHNFKRWAESVGEYVPSQKRFTQRMKDRGLETLKAGTMYFIGLRLKVSDNDPRDPAGWLPDD